MLGLALVLSLAVSSNAGLLPWMETDGDLQAQAPQGILWDGQCVADTTSRLLRVDLGKFDDNSPEACKDSCRELGYALAGVEYGEECFCGNTPPLTSTIVDQDECDEPCTGDATQMCGGSWNMNVYQTGPCHVRDMVSRGCSPLAGAEGVFLSESWQQCGLACTTNPACGAWEFTDMSVGLCFNFHSAPEDCIVSAERGQGYVTGYSGCHEGEEFEILYDGLQPVAVNDGPVEVEEPAFEQTWVTPLESERQEAGDPYAGAVEVEEPIFVQEWASPLGAREDSSD